MSSPNSTNNKSQIQAKQQHELSHFEKEISDDQKGIRDDDQHQKQEKDQSQQDDKILQSNLKQEISEGQTFMLPEQRKIDKNNPKYHFCRFISRHYRLIQDKKDRKHHFVRMQPVFVRFLHVLKLHNLSLITIDTFRKYFKKFFKKRGIKYEETTNRVDMKVVVGIDRRYNSKFQF